MSQANCTFECFKAISGKWYASGRGVLTEKVFQIFDKRKDQIIEDNNGSWPGLSGKGNEFICVAIPDEDCPHGFPLMFFPIVQTAK